MIEQISKIVARYDELERQMAEPENLANYQKMAELAQERSELEPLVLGYHEHRALSKELDETRELLEAADDEEMITMAQDELTLLTTRIEELEQKLRLLLVPKDPRDEKNVVIEIRAGAGGLPLSLHR